MADGCKKIADSQDGLVEDSDDEDPESVATPVAEPEPEQVIEEVVKPVVKKVVKKAVAAPLGAEEAPAPSGGEEA
jgi:hypothetical protein